MKKLFLFIIFVMPFNVVYAQIDSLTRLGAGKEINSSGKNELKVNLVGLAIGMPEIMYERILKQKKSIGLSVFISPEKNAEYNFGFIPYFRWYLSKPKMIMFFIEANMAAIYGEDKVYRDNGSSYKDVWGIGMGAAVGIKVVQRKSIIIEGFFGAGKALGEVRSFRIYERIGLAIGKRFN